MNHCVSSASGNPHTGSQNGDSPVNQPVADCVRSAASTPLSKTAPDVFDFEECDFPLTRAGAHSVHSASSAPQSKTSHDFLNFEECDVPENPTEHSAASAPQRDTSHVVTVCDVPATRTTHSAVSAQESTLVRESKGCDLSASGAVRFSVHSEPSTPKSTSSRDVDLPSGRSIARSDHSGSPSQPQLSDTTAQCMGSDNACFHLPHADDGSAPKTPGAFSASSDDSRASTCIQGSKVDQREADTTMNAEEIPKPRTLLAERTETLGLDEEESSGADQEMDLVMKWLGDLKSDNEEFMPMTDVQDAKVSGTYRRLHVTNLVDMEQCNPAAPAPAEDTEANAETLRLSLQETLALLRAERSRNLLLQEGLAGNVQEVFDANTDLTRKHAELLAAHAALEQEKNTLHQVALGLKRECKKQRTYFDSTLAIHEEKHAALAQQLAEAKRNARNDDYMKEVAALETISENKIAELGTKNRELEAALSAAVAEVDAAAKSKQLENVLEVSVLHDRIAELEAKNQELETTLITMERSDAPRMDEVAELEATNRKRGTNVLATEAAGNGGDDPSSSGAVLLPDAVAAAPLRDENVDAASPRRSPTNSARPPSFAIEKELRCQIAALESKNELLQATSAALRVALEKTVVKEAHDPSRDISGAKTVTHGPNLHRVGINEDFSAELEQQVVIGMDQAVQEWREVRNQETSQSGETPEFFAVRERLKLKREARSKTQNDQVTGGIMNTEVPEDDNDNGRRKMKSKGTLQSEELERINVTQTSCLGLDEESKQETNSGRSANTEVLAQLFQTRAREEKFRRRFQVLMTMR